MFDTARQADLDKLFQNGKLPSIRKIGLKKIVSD